MLNKKKKKINISSRITLQDCPIVVTPAWPVSDWVGNLLRYDSYAPLSVLSCYLYLYFPYCFWACIHSRGKHLIKLKAVSSKKRSRVIYVQSAWNGSIEVLFKWNPLVFIYSTEMQSLVGDWWCQGDYGGCSKYLLKPSSTCGRL